MDGGAAVGFAMMAAVILSFGFYLLPSIIAFKRGHHQRVAVLLVNIFAGWTFIGWVAALVWSATHIPPELRRA
jgi:hypothetical protein